VPELVPGVPTAVFARLSEQGAVKGRLALEPLALAIERQAKINLSGASHPYGTRTTAQPGVGPALVSGTLRRSVTHTPIVPAGIGGWETKVGIARGVYPPYPYRGRGGGTPKRTPSSRYGAYLERGLRNGATYPWLIPAFRFGVEIAAPTIYREIYGPTGWKRIP
jgi:hypothetical protein